VTRLALDGIENLVDRQHCASVFPVHCSRAERTQGVTGREAAVVSVDLNHFRATTKPFVTTGKIGVVLAQVTPNFKNQPATRS